MANEKPQLADHIWPNIGELNTAQESLVWDKTETNLMKKYANVFFWAYTCFVDKGLLVRAEYANLQLR